MTSARKQLSGVKIGLGKTVGKENSKDGAGDDRKLRAVHGELSHVLLWGGGMRLEGTGVSYGLPEPDRCLQLDESRQSATNAAIVITLLISMSVARPLFRD